MAAISREEVAHLARLARIEMSSDELDHLASELEAILHAVDRVQEAAKEDVPPTSHPLPLKNVTRPDVVIPSLSASDALSGAPASDEQRFKVPQILGDSE
jgi:aspartyl-tRNA(Asn)/glutamyl-tRNA(Gln) amidotransferase subunit C